MIPTCEFGDCNNYPVAEQKFGDIGIPICPTHRTQAYKIATDLRLEWQKKKVEMNLKFFKAMREGGK